MVKLLAHNRSDLGSIPSGSILESRRNNNRGGNMSIKGRRFAKEWMGKTVEVTHEFMLWGKPSVRKLAVPKRGWIVGYTYRCDNVSSSEGSTVCCGPRRLVFLVSYWPGRQLEDVPPSGVRLCDTAPTCPPDWIFEGSEIARQQYAFYASELSRDSKGRWVKSTLQQATTNE